MKYIDNNTRFSGTSGALGSTILFENQQELDQYAEEMRNRPGYKYQLWDEHPISFPCLMMEIGEMYNPNGADWKLNAFIYDAVIHEDDDEDEEERVA